MQTILKKNELKKHCFLFAVSLVLVIVLAFICCSIQSHAASVTVDLGAGEAGETNGVLDIFLLFAFLALMPSLLIMTTSFTRIIIVMSFLRNALGTQQSPPNQVLVGIALFLSLFIMFPVLQEVNTVAYEPYKAGTITQTEALDRASVPLKQFMLKQTKANELKLFLDISGQELDQTNGESLESLTDLGLEVVIPAFITSELKKAFAIGFYLYIPFLIIDLVVSSALMSMGMVMLPPSMISLPFKIMLFVLVDGWNLLFSSLVQGFH